MVFWGRKEKGLIAGVGGSRLGLGFGVGAVDQRLRWFFPREVFLREEDGETDGIAFVDTRIRIDDCRECFAFLPFCFSLSPLFLASLPF
jgi:hypothetical protein